jgi:hypothetical protein
MGAATFAFLGRPVMNGNGELIFQSRSTGAVTPSDDNAFHEMDAGGTISLLLREGEPIPGAPGFEAASLPQSVQFNTAGDILTNISLAPGIPTDADTAVLGTSGGVPLSILTREGDSPSGLGTSVFISHLSASGIQNASGHAAFRVPLRGAGVSPPADDTAILHFRDDALEVVLREGDPLPTLGGQIVSSPTVGALNNVEDLIVGMSLSSVPHLLLIGDDGLEVVVQASEVPPGRPDLSYEGFFGAQLNDARQVAFNAQLGIAPAESATGCLRWSQGVVTPILLPGDEVEIGPGDTRTIDSCSIPYGDQKGINQQGDVVLDVSFVEGGGGLFIDGDPPGALVPGLGAHGVLVLALAMSGVGVAAGLRKARQTTPS